MSDSESNESVTASEESTDQEDIVVQSSVVKPYMFEPEAPSDYDDNPADEDGILRETLEARFSKTVAVTSWCTCEHCSDVQLQAIREYRCCKEILQCVGKFTFEGQNAACITQHWDYPVVTHRTVLETAGAFLADKTGRKYRRPTNRSETAQNEYLRAVAYRWLVRWVFGMLGWDNSRPLPACLYNDIRKRYPSQNITGYSSSEQREQREQR